MKDFEVLKEQCIHEVTRLLEDDRISEQACKETIIHELLHTCKFFHIEELPIKICVKILYGACQGKCFAF